MNDTLHPGATVLLAGALSLLVAGLVFVAGRSHAVLVSGGFAFLACALFVVGVLCDGGLSMLLMSLAGAVLLGMLVGWTTLPVDET